MTAAELSMAIFSTSRAGGKLPPPTVLANLVSRLGCHIEELSFSGCTCALLGLSMSAFLGLSLIICRPQLIQPSEESMESIIGMFLPFWFSHTQSLLDRFVLEHSSGSSGRWPLDSVTASVDCQSLGNALYAASRITSSLRTSARMADSVEGSAVGPQMKHMAALGRVRCQHSGIIWAHGRKVLGTDWP